MMDNIGRFTLGLVNAEWNPATEPDCRVEFVRLDEVTILRSGNLQFPPTHAFGLPAFPQGKNLHCVVTPSLYRIVQSGFFTLTESEPKDESVLVMRIPEKWSPDFAPWNSLAAPFRPLQTILAGKLLKLKHGPDVGLITAETYDGMNSPALVLAKMALLNLFVVLSTQTDPVTSRSWFSFVSQVLVIDRERFVAKVDPELYASIDKIHGDLNTFKGQGFFMGDTSQHLDNIPSEYQLTADMISVKRVYEQGNVQFTMAKVRNAAGDYILLDCDMDEHSNILEHLSDWVTHAFTGGTHPIDIHEYIVHLQKGVDLGYALRPS